MNKISSIPILVLISLLASCNISESMAWVISTFVGNGTPGFENGTGSTVRFNLPRGVAVDSEGNVYVAEQGNHRIRKITPAGVVSTFAGSTSGYKDATGIAAQFYSPIGVAVDSESNVYVTDHGNQRIRKITPTGVVSTFAGTGTPGHADGASNTAQFNYPSGVIVDSSGNIYVADTHNNRIRKITPADRIEDRMVSTIAGTGSATQFDDPSGVAVDSRGNVYVADTGNNRIRKIAPTGVVSTIAGTNTAGHVDDTGTDARFNSPNGVAVDSRGNVYVADSENNRIRKITPAGVVSTIAGTGSMAQFNQPRGVAVDSSGNIYVADFNNHRIRKVEYKVP